MRGNSGERRRSRGTAGPSIRPMRDMRPNEFKPESATAKTTRKWRIVIVVVGLLIAFYFVVGAMLSLSAVTASATSPDGRLRAEIVDRRLHFIDRNFRLRIVDPKRMATVVFTSPDESPRGVGHDRLLWSSDSRRLLLIGPNFWVREEAKLKSGESLYLLYDAPSGSVWCNSDQDGPPFGEGELAGYDFGESMAMR